MLPRKYQRYGVSFPISFEGDEEGEGIVTNVSMGGCQVTCQRGVGRRAYLSALLCLSDGERPVKIHVAVVKWSSERGFGLQFRWLDSKEEHRLSQYMAQLG